MIGIYIGRRPELRGHRALMFDPNMGTRHCPRGFLFAQFNSVSTELGNPLCLQSGGPEPLPGDLRFGWHLFKKREFDIELEHE